MNRTVMIWSSGLLAAVVAVALVMLLVRDDGGEDDALACKGVEPLAAASVAPEGKRLPAAQVNTAEARFPFPVEADGVQIGTVVVFAISSPRERIRSEDLLKGFSTDRDAEQLRVGGRDGLIAREDGASVAVASATRCAAVFVAGADEAAVLAVAADLEL